MVICLCWAASIVGNPLKTENVVATLPSEKADPSTAHFTFLRRIIRAYTAYQYEAALARLYSHRLRRRIAS
jgi:hypothetical protein